MIHYRYPLSELIPIKPVIKHDMRLAGIEHSLETFGLLSPLVITKDKKIIDGNKRWYVLIKMHGYAWVADVISCDIAMDSVWPAHLIINTFPLIPVDPARNLLDTISDSLKWRLLSELKFSVTTTPEKEN